MFTVFDDCPCPESLRRYHELNEQYEVWERRAWAGVDPTDEATVKRLEKEEDEWYAQMELAWTSAPLRDRIRHDCRLARKAWQEIKQSWRRGGSR